MSHRVLSHAEFDVLTSTHDELKDKVPPRRTRVLVSDEYKDPDLVAAQIAAATSNRMPIDVQARI